MGEGRDFEGVDGFDVSANFELGGECEDFFSDGSGGDSSDGFSC